MTPITPVGYLYKTVPWEHQREATSFLIGIDAALLDCWMGTGKTKIVLDALHALKHSTILVLCPLAAIRVWQDETDKHSIAPLRIVALEGGSVAKRAKTLSEALLRAPRPLLVALNYEAAWRSALAQAIVGHEWDMLVLDESHRIKAPGGKASRFCAAIKARQRVALTGTPLPHSPLDIYAQYRALDPGIYGLSFARFRAKYAVMGGYEGRQVVAYQNETDLRKRMDTIRLHIPGDVLSLPPIQVIDRKCTLGPAAARHYREMEGALITQVGQGIVTAANALAKLLRLQQITSGFLPIPDDDDPTRAWESQFDTAKADLLAELLEDMGPHEPCVVFARFKHDLIAVHNVALKLDRHCLEISGRCHHYPEWRAGQGDTLAVQIQAGGLGIDLTRARYGVYYSLGFSLGDYQQSMARLHRPGQTRPTIIYRLLAEGTVDERITRALEARREVVEAILAELKGAEDG